jgi:DNA-binding IclR family transcriptional regulator
LGEPVWDLLLAMLIARVDGRTLTAAEAFEAAGVKRSAGRRVVAEMEAHGLIERLGRRLRLTDAAAGRLTDYLLAGGN